MAAGRTGLGRGLGALIPGGGGVDEVDIDLIAPNPEQPRARIDPDTLAELAASVREHGLLQPLVVTRQVAPSGAVSYQLIAGERRLHAARMAGMERVPVVVRETSARGLLELALVENVQRADLGPLEAAAAFRRLVDEFGLTQGEVAARVGKSQAAVSNTMRLLDLPAEVRDGLAGGKITEGHARALLGLPDTAARLGLYAEVVAKGLSVRQTEELVRRLRDSPTPPGPRSHQRSGGGRTPDPDLAAIEERLRSALGTQVRLERGRKGGRIVIQFYGDEDLEGLLSRLLSDDTGG
jgi:ParB family chromosome partitioning protein